MRNCVVQSILILCFLTCGVNSLEAQFGIFGGRRKPKEPEVNSAHERAKMEAEQAYERGEYQRSIDLASSVLRQNSRDAVAYYLRAGARVELGLSESRPRLIRDGVADARESIRLDTKNTVMYYLPYLYGMTNLASLESHKAHAETSVKVAGEILARPKLQQDEKSNLLYQRAIAYVYLQAFEKAAKDYESAIQIDRKHLGAHIGLADAYIQAAKKEKAVEAYGKAIEVFPNNPLVYNNRGMYLQELNKVDDAIIDFTRALELEPQYFYAYTNRGYALMQSGDALAAEADFSSSLEVNSNQPSVYSLRSTSRLMQGKIRDALSDQAQAVRLTPQDSGAHADLGFLYFFSGDYAAAELSFKKASTLGAEMKHLDPWRYLAIELTGKTVRAREEFLPSIKDDSESRDWIDHLMAYLLGRMTEKQLLGAVSSEPAETRSAQLCEAHYFIGLRKNRMGQTALAQQHFKKALQTKANYLSAFRGAQVALKKFTSLNDPAQ